MTDIGQQLADLKRRVSRIERASRLGSASLDGTALEVRDPGNGGLRGIIGQQPDGTTAVNIVNGAAPPAPSTPTVAPALGGIAVTWDGALANGAVFPLDWARVEVHASTSNGFVPDATTLRATIETQRGAVVYLPATAPQYVVTLARNTSGTASAPSAQAGPYAPRPVVDTDVADGSITETKIANDAVTTPKIKAGAVQADQIAANAITTGKIAAGAVDAVALKADAITGKTITGGDINGAVVTGGTIQTSEDDPAVVITGDDNYMRVYNDVGAVTFLAGGPNGTVLSPSTTAVSSDLSITNGIAAFGYDDGTHVAAQILGELGGNSIQLNGGYPDGGTKAGARLRLVYGANTGTTGRPVASLDSPNSSDRLANLMLTGTVLKGNSSGVADTWQTPALDTTRWTLGNLAYRRDALDNVVWTGTLTYIGTAIVAATQLTNVLQIAVAAAYRPKVDRRVVIAHCTSAGITKNTRAEAILRSTGQVSIAWGDGVTGSAHDAAGLAVGDIFEFCVAVPLGNIA